MTQSRSEIPLNAVRLSQRERIAFATVLYGGHSVRTVQQVCGDLSPSTAHVALSRLKRLGLVTWTEGQKGTLRPAVRVVA